MTVKKLIAALLALALITVMPALGEDNAPDLNAGVDITLAQADGIDLDAAPELSGNLEIDGGINAGLTVDGEPAAASSDGTADNDSKPAPDYRGKDFMLTVDRDLEQTVMIGDHLYLMVVEAVIQSVASDNERVAYVSGSASKAILIFANSVGTANITVTLEDGTSYNVALTVEDRVPPEGMSLSEKSVTLLTGQDIDLTAYIVLKPTYAKPSFTYKSSDGAVVKVNRQGIARALKPGRATVTITTQNGLKKSMKVVSRQIPGAADLRERLLQSKRKGREQALGTHQAQHGRRQNDEEDAETGQDPGRQQIQRHHPEQHQPCQHQAADQEDLCRR